MHNPNLRFKGYGYFGDTPDLATLTLSSATGIDVPTFTLPSALNVDATAPAGGTPAGGVVGQAQTPSLFSNPLFLIGAVILGGALLFTLTRK